MSLSSLSRNYLTRISDSGIYKSFFNNHPDAVYVVDLEGNYIDANPASTEITGYSREEFLSVGFFQLIIPEKLEQAFDAFKKLIDGQSQIVETAILHKDGHIVCLTVTGTPIVMQGEVIGVFCIAKDITKQKNTERFLKEREQRYQSLKRYNPNGICSFDLQGRVIGANPAYEQITGYSLDELKHMNVLETLVFDEDSEWVRSIFVPDALLENVETRIRHKKGHSVYVRATSVPIIIDKMTIGFYMIVQDITKEKRDQQMLFETQRLFTLLSENSLDIFSFSTPDGIFRYVSPAVRTLLGYDPEEVIGKPNTAFYHPDDLESIYEIGRRMSQGNRVNRFTCRTRHKDGHYLWFETTLQAIRDQQGEIIQVAGVGRDITERMATEQKLQLSEERYRRLVDNSLDAVGVIENGKWAYLNATGLKLFGASKEEEIIGRVQKDFLHPDHHEECAKRIEAIIAGNPVGFVEQRWFRLNGEVFHAEAIGIPFSETAIQVILRDVTDQKRTSELLLRSEKLTAVGQLAAGVAHEIRNPLTALKGFTQILHSKTSDSNRHYFDIMKGELDRIEMILSEMLVLAKPQAVTFKQHHIDLILQEVITLLATQAVMKDVIIESEFEDNAPMVSCEESQLKQVFINIIKNAIEAMPSGGRLLARLKKENDTLCIEFIDEGEGIPEVRIPKLGEPFYSTKEKGTGLGLMVSHKIISSHKGNIDISSIVGKGTTVKVTLPIV